MRNLLARLKMDAHHKIEWFGVSLFSLLLAMTLVSTSIMIKHHSDSKERLGSQSMYTQSFTTSISGISGTVSGIYSNSTNTRVFLLLKIADISNMPADANSYQMFLTGSSLSQKGTHMNINPSGAIYMFGSTGYMGIYLTESRGFDPQILSLVVRSNEQLQIDDNALATSQTLPDSSFSKYDQFQIYFNPGASGIEYNEVLDEQELKVSDLYEALITRPDEDALRKQLDSDVKTMRTDIDRINEYTNRLMTTDRVQVPAMPSAIAGDTYTIDPNDESKIYMNMASVVPSGVDFNWRDGSIKTGYLDNIVGGMSYKDYFATLDAESTGSIDVSNMTWLTTSGEVISLDSSTGVVTTKDTAIINDITGLQQAWRTYYSDKTAYQVTDLRKLLSLELDVKESDSVFTINNSENVLTNWQSK